MRQGFTSQWSQSGRKLGFLRFHCLIFYSQSVSDDLPPSSLTWAEVQQLILVSDMRPNTACSSSIVCHCLDHDCLRSDPIVSWLCLKKQERCQPLCCVFISQPTSPLRFQLTVTGCFFFKLTVGLRVCVCVRSCLLGTDTHTYVGCCASLWMRRRRKRLCQGRANEREIHDAVELVMRRRSCC